MPSLNTKNAILSNAITVDSSYNVAIGGTPTAIGGYTSLIINNNSTGSFLDLNNSGINNLRLLSLGLVDQRIQAQGTLRFDTAGIARMAITSDGNVGIGTSSPEVMLQVGANDSTNKVFSVRFSSVPLYINGGYDGSAALSTFSTNNYNTSNGSSSWSSFSNTNFGSSAVQLAATTGGAEIRFLTGSAVNTNPTERMRITSGGNVGIGTSSPNKNGINRALTVNASSGTSMYELCVGDTSTTTYWQFTGTDSSLINVANGYLRFGTADTERMRISSGGCVVINSTATSAEYSTGVYKLITKVGTDRNIAFGIQGGDCSIESFNDAVNAGTPLRIYAYPLYFPTTAGDTTGSGANMVIDGTSGRIYRSTSSLKYKKNVENYTKGLAEVMQMRPVTYNSKNEKETQTFAGFIAEEIHDLGLAEFVQYAEDESPDALSYGNMVSLLVKAIQELNQTVQDQQQQINSLINR